MQGTRKSVFQKRFGDQHSPFLSVHLFSFSPGTWKNECVISKSNPVFSKCSPNAVGIISPSIATIRTGKTRICNN